MSTWKPCARMCASTRCSIRSAIGFLDEPHVDFRDRAIGNDRARLIADIAALEPADVQRRELQRFLKVVADLFGAMDAEEPLQLVAAIGHGRQNLPLLGESAAARRRKNR